MSMLVYVNGRPRTLPPGRGGQTLLEFLRESERLTGTKLGCGEGGCGACTVMVSCWEAEEGDTTQAHDGGRLRGRIVHRAVNACLAPVYSVIGMHVVTVEGISIDADGRRALHPVQRRLSEMHGQQCGFCTPGFVMSMYCLMRERNGDGIAEEDIEEAISGNLCRCTGYRPILDAFRCFAKTDDSAYQRHYRDDVAAAAPAGSACPDTAQTICPSTGLPCPCNDNGGCGTGGPPGCDGSGSAASKVAETHKEVIFPHALKSRHNEVSRESLAIPFEADASLSWYRPTTKSDLLELRSRLPEARLIVGSTEISIENRARGLPKGGFIAATHVPELQTLALHDSGVSIGASVTLSSLQAFLRAARAADPGGCALRACDAVDRQLRWFAGVQIRNVASVGGNICTASPISDLNPLWVASGSTFRVESAARGARDIRAEEFFTGYRRTALLADEVLVEVRMPLCGELEYFREFKQSHRREDDIAIVNAGMRARFEERTEGGRSAFVCVDAALCFGGVGPTPVVAARAQEFIVGKRWDSREVLTGALQALMEDVELDDSSPGGMPEFRRSLVASFFFKFFAHVCGDLASKGTSSSPSFLSDADIAAGAMPTTEAHLPVMGAQVYDTAAEKVAAAAMASGAAIKHRSADQHVTGEAKYGDDIELPASGLHGALVLSTTAHARVVAIDTGAASASAGFHAFISAKDIPGENNIGPAVHDEEIFVEGEVRCVGQFIGLVLADTQAQAKEAAKLVRVTYEELPAIMGIREAIEAGSFLTAEKELTRGDVDAVLSPAGEKEGCTRITGEIALGGQEHFYLEPNNVTVIPGENGEMLSISSTQAPAKHQKIVAAALGVPMNKVVCKTKRIGGGFGGKETRAIAIDAAAAVAAWTVGKAVRINLDRDEDMSTTGHRHPMLGKYTVVHQEDGTIIGADIHIYSNGGLSMDLSEPVIERAMFHADNCYNIPNLRVRGVVCKTNTPSNTAFRGFGGPQGMMIAEALMDDVARSSGKSPEVIRERHMYVEGDLTHFGTRLDDFRVPDCYRACSERLPEMRRSVDEFNKNSKWRKRGVAVVPTKFGISFTATFMNQAGALVNIYTDGTVLVTHGGVEMGQGLHTKIAQIVATELGIPVTEIFIAETSTDKVPNASPTAASASTDLYGAAARDACLQLKGRLQPFIDSHPGDFKKAVNAAYMSRVDLSAHGFYITPDIGWDWATRSGRPFHYFTNGAALSEVEIDVLSGDSRVLRCDIVMDVGLPINPAIDVGQIEGGYVQGLGWCLLEELKWGDLAHPWARPGHLITRGPGAYKIPTADDIPREFNVTLLRDAPNPCVIHSSKAVGEPPFFLAASAFFAVKDAVYAARADSDKGDVIPLDLPATPERVRLACGDEILSYAVPNGVCRARLSN